MGKYAGKEHEMYLKLCKKYKLGEYARHTGDTPPDSGDEG